MMSPDLSADAAYRRVRAQALFDAVLRTPARIPDTVRFHCAEAVGLLGEPFAEVVAVRTEATDTVFRASPPADVVEAVLRAGLRELGFLAAHEFERAFAAVEAGHDALLALS